MQNICIDDAIFEIQPDFYRGVLIVRDANNIGVNCALAQILSDVAQSRLGMDIQGHPAIRAWEDAHMKCGSNPNKFPPAVKALLKRAANGQPIPFVNPIVALFNITSIKYVMPCGGDDAAATTGDLVLGIANGSEIFVPLGQPEKHEHPTAGEVIYFDRATNEVMCRRWNWRNGDRTKIQPSSRHMVINIDCLPPLTPSDAIRARDELAHLIVSNCQAEVAVDYLDQHRCELPLVDL